ncbi:ABC transporter substrate-binding protein [Micrococcus sp. 2A]|uniref:ABC transporter substrate-binding protein n=1 Tax=unclassified Micrococcus TaxID=2620948 RepID=UPI002611272C|nr:ABC transporter substrate-binding protein [uncultured Micrococcus sp.]
MNHRSLRITAALAAVALGLTACGGSGSADSASSSAAGSAGGSSAAVEEYTVGINQLTTHPALDATREGFKEAFADAGLKVEFDEQNAQGDQATVTSIASTFASASDVDLVAAIATPAAQGTASAVKDKPVVFMAVTDPKAAELVKADDAPGGNVTGVSDRNPVKEQLQLLKDVKPDAKTVGIVYNSGEVNSKVQVDQAKAAGKELGLEVKEATITNSSEVQQGVQALGDVDGIYVPTDNAVVSALETVLSYGKDKKAPVISADTDSVEKGALGTFGIDYKEHGKQAGEMAVKILRDGAKPESTPVGFADPASLELVLNKEAATSFGVELPQELLGRADEVIGG